ncbi:MAG: glycosyltransferase family 4 protein [Gaiellaceae bacterium]
MTADTVGGVWTYAVDLVDALARQGVEVHVATMGRLPDDDQRRALPRLYESSYRLEWEDDPWTDVEEAGSWLLGLARELEPDLVHLNGYVHARLPWPAPVLVAAHSDIVSWWRAVHASAPPAVYDRYISGVSAGLRAAHAVVAPTRAVLDDLERNYRFASPQFVVANGRAAVSSVVPKEPFVAAVGRFWDAAKNLPVLERIGEGSRWPVVAAGPGTAVGRLAQAEVGKLLARAAIFASPVRYEPFGLTILEAAAAGCALVLADIPSLRELWADAAVFAPSDDAEAFGAAIDALTRDDELRASLAHRARRRAALYSLERMGEGYLAVYDTVRAAVAA